MVQVKSVDKYREWMNPPLLFIEINWTLPAWNNLWSPLNWSSFMEQLSRSKKSSMNAPWNLCHRKEGNTYIIQWEINIFKSYVIFLYSTRDPLEDNKWWISLREIKGKLKTIKYRIIKLSQACLYIMIKRWFL